MIEPRSVYASLLNDPRLDSLLVAAQEKSAEQGVTDETETVSEINKIADDVQATAAQVRKDLMHELNQKVALRKEKVAIVIHMLKVASKLSA